MGVTRLTRLLAAVLFDEDREPDITGSTESVHSPAKKVISPKQDEIVFVHRTRPSVPHCVTLVRAGSPGSSLNVHRGSLLAPHPP